jgi:hypothetical protein
MTDGMIGRHLVTTGDGVAWADPAIDRVAMDEMMEDLIN